MTEFKVGLLTLATLASVIILSFKITSHQTGFGTYITYKTIVPDSAGIFEKSPIKIAGINAGRIKAIQLYEDKAMIIFEILSDIKIVKGSKIQIKTTGLLGEKYLDIFLNHKSDERLPENSIVDSTELGNLDRLLQDASTILQDVKSIVHNVKTSLSPERENDPFPLELILRNLKNISQDIRYELDSNNPDSILGRVRKFLPTLDNVNAASKDLKTIMSRIRKGQGSLGKLLNDDEVVDHVTETLSSVKKLVNKVNSIRTELQVFTSAHSEQNNMTDINLDIYPSLESFYRLGVVTSEFGVEKRKEVTTSIDKLPPSTTETTERKKGTYRFNAMIGKKIQNWTIRFGLLESSGGFGVDYNFTKYNVQLYLDLFDYRESIGPQIKMGLNMQFWNVFYGKIAGEDLIAGQGRRGISLGAGLKFTDEDLKGLMGFFF